MDGEFEKNPFPGGSFSQLLDSVGGGVGGMGGMMGGFDMGVTNNSFTYPSCFPPGNSPTMLCFEKSFQEPKEPKLVLPTQNQKCCGGGDSSSPSSSNNSSSSSGIFTKSNIEAKTTTEKLAESEKSSKKAKIESPKPTSRPTKVRKEKLGERITALQQLVSPFGKTDTASVLHEAMGYIRFLHDQVQVLSSPYLQSMPVQEEEREKGVKYDLRSRGLCLVPVECTANVASSNGADFWSPAMGNSSVKH